MLQLVQIRLEFFPGDISGVCFTQEKWPLLLGELFEMQGAIRMGLAVGTSVAEGTGIARIAQHAQHRVVQQRGPMNLAIVRPGAHPARKEESLVPKISHGPPGRPDAFEGREQETDGLLDLRIRIQDYVPILRIEQTDRQRNL